MKFVFSPDGDQRLFHKDFPQSDWQVVYLPTDSDPDTLFMTLHADVAELALRLGQPHHVVRTALGGLEGSDPHDWVIGLGERFGRHATLQALANIWVSKNPEAVDSYCEELETGGEPGSRT